MSEIQLPTVKFTVPTADGKDGRAMNPATKGSGRALVFGGRAVVFNDNPKNKAWAQRVGWIAKEHRPANAPWGGAVELRLLFRMRKPKSLPKDRSFPVVKPDLDKMIRSVKDALTGILYKDDAQIIFLKARKIYAEHSFGEPGVDIELVDLSPYRDPLFSIQEKDKKHHG